MEMLRLQQLLTLARDSVRRVISKTWTWTWPAGGSSAGALASLLAQSKGGKQPDVLESMLCQSVGG